MNIYLISQEVNSDYDTYDSAIVAANNVKDAQKMHPSNGAECLSRDEIDYYTEWCGYEDVRVELLGVAMQGTKKMVLLASYNAG